MDFFVELIGYMFTVGHTDDDQCVIMVEDDVLLASIYQLAYVNRRFQQETIELCLINMFVSFNELQEGDQLGFTCDDLDVEFDVKTKFHSNEGESVGLVKTYELGCNIEYYFFIRCGKRIFYINYVCINVCF